MDKTTAIKLVEQYQHWHQKFEIFPDVVTPGSYDPNFLLQEMHLPESLAGKTALDVGSCDGFYSSELHKRGADVTALDYRPKTVSGFSITEEVMGISIRHLVANVYDIGPHLGQFDIVLCLGVIYHLPDIPAAIWKLRQVCCGTLFLETYVEELGTPDSSNVPLCRYYEGGSLADDPTNFWAPNAACVEAILRDCGFLIKASHRWGDRLLVEAEPTKVGTKMSVAYGAYPWATDQT